MCTVAIVLRDFTCKIRTGSTIPYDFILGVLSQGKAVQLATQCTGSHNTAKTMLHGYYVNQTDLWKTGQVM